MLAGPVKGIAPTMSAPVQLVDSARPGKISVEEASAGSLKGRRRRTRVEHLDVVHSIRRPSIVQRNSTQRTCRDWYLELSLMQRKRSFGDHLFRG